MAINTHDFPAIGEWVAPDFDENVHVGLIRWERGKNVSLEFTSIFPTMTTSSRMGGLRIPLVTGEVNFLGDCTLLSLQDGGMKLANNGSTYEWQARIGLIGKKLVDADEKFIRYVELTSKDLLQVLRPTRESQQKIADAYVIDLTEIAKTWIDTKMKLTIESAYEGSTNFKTFDIKFHRPMTVKIAFEEAYSVDELIENIVLPLKNLFETIDLEQFTFDSLQVWEESEISRDTPEDALAAAASKLEIIGDFLNIRNVDSSDDQRSQKRISWRGPTLDESMQIINSLSKIRETNLISGVWYFLRAKGAGIPLDSRLSYLFGLIDSYYYSEYPVSESKVNQHKISKQEILELLSKDEISQVLDDVHKTFLSENLLNLPRRPTYEEILITLSKRMGIQSNHIWEVIWKARGINPGSDWRLMYSKLHKLRNHIQHGGKIDLNTAVTAEDCLIQFIRLLILFESGVVDQVFCKSIAGEPPKNKTPTKKKIKEKI